MAGVFVSPGVEIQERDFSDYAPALASSIFGVVGGASWGPLNEVRLITNENALIKEFGKPGLSGEDRALYPALIAGMIYLRQGRQFKMVRQSDGTGVKATKTLVDAGTSALITSTVDLAGGIDLSTNKYTRIDINNLGPLLIDLSSGAAVPSAVTRAEIMANLVAALVTANDRPVTVTGVDTGAQRFIRIETTSGGTTSEVEFVAPPGGSAAAASRESSLAEPFNFQFLATPHLSFDFDNNGAQTVTLAADGASQTTGNGPFTLANAQTLILDLRLPGETTLLGQQTIRFLTGDFSNIAAATATEVAKVINRDAIGVSATVSGSAVVLETDKKGTGARLQIVGGTAVTPLGLTAGTYNGTGDVADIRIVTAQELADAINDLPPADYGEATVAAGKVTVASGTTGSAAELEVVNGGGFFTNGVYTGTDASAALDATAAVFGAAFGTPYPKTTNGTGPFNTWRVDALYTGVRGNTIEVEVEDGTTADTKSVTVRVEGFEIETFDNLTNDNLEDEIDSDWITITDVLTSDELPANGLYSLISGADGISGLDAADLIGAEQVDGTRTGLKLYSNAETQDVNLLAVPGYEGADAGAVIGEMDLICQARGDCMFLADPPFGLTVQEAIDWHNGTGYDHSAFNTSWGAGHWSWVQVMDNYNQTPVWSPPSGHVARACAYTDLVSDPWFAPAGYTRGRIPDGLKLEIPDTPDKGQRNAMYGPPNALNPIVDFNTRGIVIWGQRTFQRQPTALDRINVRRLMLTLRKTVSTAVASLTFEPNDQDTWFRFLAIMEPLLRSIKARRGLYDFKVKMDESTNTPDVIDRSEMHGKVLLKPTKAAEVIVVEFTLLPTGATFAETL